MMWAMDDVYLAWLDERVAERSKRNRSSLERREA
jgi:hypothetical protein